METRELTCIRCPIGCSLKVTVDGENVTVLGNHCPRGMEYGKKEVTAPTRTVTSSVRVTGGVLPLASVKTVPEIPKEKIFDVMRAIRSFTTAAPVRTGEKLIENIAGTGSDLVATRTVEQK